MGTLQQLLERKGSDVFSISPEKTVFEAISKMAEKEVGSLAVIDRDILVGLITETLYTRNVILKGRSSRNTPVRDVMETQVIFARPDQTVEECMAIMTEKRTRHLPVIDEDKLIGMVSLGDLVKHIIEEQRFTIDQLTHYIQG